MKRVRFSCRPISWRGFHYVRDVFTDGTVYRVWLGFWLLKWMVRRSAVALLLGVLVVGCGNKNKPVVQPPPEIRTVTVEVPTIVKATPPPELLTPLKPPLPVFISPFDPEATSALTAEGERFLRALIEELLQRIDAWKKWADAKD